MIDNDSFSSMCWFGPTGTGKTTLARIISKTTKHNFIEINATQSGSKEIKECINKAKTRFDLKSQMTIVYIDEIHRLSKNQLDILLPHVEDGCIILICTTTENPYFCLIPALVSRLLIYEFKPISSIDLAGVLQMTIKYYKSNNINININKNGAKHLIYMSNGDIRKLLMFVQMLVDIYGDTHITEEMCRAVAPNKHVFFAKDGSAHFDLMSAIQGAIQASDVHGAVFFLAKSINSGEKIEVICRRLLVTASEDVGCANPMAAVHTHACVESALKVGFPEAAIILSSAVSYLAIQPRSKAAARAIWKALDLDKHSHINIPDCLKDCHYKGAKSLGHGSYQDGHDIDEYIRVADDIFIPECGDEVKYMHGNSILWESRDDNC